MNSSASTVAKRELFLVEIRGRKFIGYLNSKIEHIFSSSPYYEVIILGGLNVHYFEVLSFISQGTTGELIFYFFVQNNPEYP